MLVRVVCPEMSSCRENPFATAGFVDLSRLCIGRCKHFKEVGFAPQTAEVFTTLTGRNVTKIEAVDIDDLELPIPVDLVVKDITRRIIEVVYTGIVHARCETRKGLNE